ncbi:hypothetical protein MCC93_09980 [Morococcus cerebrosus]|uniref:Uncharacterized protein n=1 Tax=Morococcus cerebrosus TaxID=1056807 RepID=A0A0C1EKD4_9NEIS|nr:hypothetical protein MCC93_09980 [Morococcus cerebrosus]
MADIELQISNTASAAKRVQYRSVGFAHENKGSSENGKQR